MQKIFNVDKWEVLAEGGSLEFTNPRARNVRLEVNAPQETALYYIDPEDGVARFLALVKGRDSIEFGTTGAFQLSVEGPDVWIYTADGADIAQRVVAPEIFTKIVERRRRNPELEQLMHLMQRNMERNLERQLDERERLSAARAEAATPRAPAPSVPEPAGVERSQADHAGASYPQAPTTHGGIGNATANSGGAAAPANDVSGRGPFHGQPPVPSEFPLQNPAVEGEPGRGAP